MQFRHAQAPALSAIGAEGAQAAAAPQGQAQQPHAGQAEAPAQVETFVRDGRKVGRNEPCPCGSGKEVQTLPRCAFLSGLMKQF